MIEVDEGGVVDAPLEDVWGFMTDLGTMRLRDPSVVSVDWTPPLKAGSIATLVVRQMITRRIRYEVVEMERNRLFRVSATVMGVQIHGTWRFEQIDEGRTKLSVSVRMDTGGLLRLVSPYLSYSVRRGAAADFKRTKLAIEARRPGAEENGSSVQAYPSSL